MFNQNFTLLYKTYSYNNIKLLNKKPLQELDYIKQAYIILPITFTFYKHVQNYKINLCTISSCNI